ncbi:MAG TPA: SxtJ family membrane protein [Pyrinomonadaceae bacterium]|nr:SxtJ family membrane protein [Pyrinomonadaceae bacterium]
MTKSAGRPEVTNSEARQSALVVACVLLLIAAWNLYRGRVAVAVVFGSVAGALFLMAWLWPAAARRFHTLWMGLGGALGYVNSRILLSLVFYLIFVPYNLLSRLAGRDPLNRRRAAGESYWTRRETTRQAKEQFERLF